MPEYSDMLLDPRWQKKRLGILERDRWACVYCGSEDKTLHVHHIFYIKGRPPWEYPDGLLVTLCCDCHQGDGKKEIIKEVAGLLCSVWRADMKGCNYFCRFAWATGLIDKAGSSGGADDEQ